MPTSPVQETEVLNGVRLAWIEAGDGPPAILLHGFPQTNHCWKKPMESLGARMRVVAPNMRGYPGSEAPEDLSAYTLDVLAADIAALARHISRQPVCLAGHDWGGVVAWATAALHPELVSRLAIIDAPHPDLFLSQARARPGQFLKSWYLVLFQIPGVAEWFFSRDPVATFGKVLKGSAGVRSAFTPEDIEHYARALGTRAAISPPLRYYRASFRALLSGTARRLPRILCPTLVLWGDKDHALGLSLLDGLENAVDAPLRKVILEGCGHWVPEEAPERVSQELLAHFLGEP